MSRKAKYSPETKASACEDYLSGNLYIYLINEFRQSSSFLNYLYPIYL